MKLYSNMGKGGEQQDVKNQSLKSVLLLLPLLVTTASCKQHRPQGRSKEAIGEYLYREEILDPCRRMGNLGSLSAGEEQAILHRVTQHLQQAKQALAHEDCHHLQLTSLLGNRENYTTLDRSQQAAAVHLAVASVQAHLLFLRLDWTTSQGLPCGSYTATSNISRAYRRLSTSWETLSCASSRSLSSSLASPTLELNLSSVLATPVHRRTHCRARTTRDCIVLNMAATTVSRLRRLLQSPSL